MLKNEVVQTMSLNFKFLYLAKNSKFSRSNSYFLILTPTFLRDGFLNSYFQNPSENSVSMRGWSGGAKVLCILHHRGVQLILAYSWARPAILVVGKGRGGMFLFLLGFFTFIPVPLSSLSLSFLYSLFYLFSPFLWETTQNDPQGLTCR